MPASTAHLRSGAAERDVWACELDVADDAGIEGPAGWIAREFSRLDILIDNAAIVRATNGPSGGLFRDRQPIPW